MNSTAQEFRYNDDENESVQLPPKDEDSYDPWQELEDINHDIQELISCNHFNGSATLLHRLADLDWFVRNNMKGEDDGSS